MNPIRVVNPQEKFALFSEHWSPKIVGQINDMHVKFVKLEGEFHWHHHDNEDELFWVVKGELTMKLRDQELTIRAGEFVIIPKGVEHLPIAREEVWLMLIEPTTTVNTGTEVNERTVTPEWL
jgi:mannose-6-phosphate isomerase-like protein (cupin superfamily)